MGVVALSTYAADEAHRYRFTVTFPDGGTPSGPNSGDNAHKGDSDTVDYNWDAIGTYLGWAFILLGTPRARFLLLGLPALLIAFTMLGRLWREGGRLVAEGRTS